MKHATLVTSLLRNDRSFVARNKAGVLALLFLSAHFSAASAQTTWYWDPSSSTGTGSYGSGTWSASTGTWYNGTADTTWANSASTNAFFDAPGSGATVTLSGALTANAIFFGAGANYTLSGASSTITLTDSPASGSYDVTVGASTTDTITAGLLSNFEVFSIGSGSSLTLAVTNTSTSTTMNFLKDNASGYALSGGGTLYLDGGTFVAGGTNIIGTGANLNVEAGELYVGGNSLQVGASGPSGGTGTLTVDGGFITGPTGFQLTVGRNASTNAGVLNMSSGSITDVTPTTSQSMSVMVGRSGSPGTLNVSGGTLTVADVMAIAADANSKGTVNISGGTSYVGSIILNATSSNQSGAVVVGDTGGTGTLNVSGGTLYIGSGNSSDVSGTKSLTTTVGGTIGIVNFNTAGAQTGVSINLSGGTIGATSNWASALNMALSNTNGGVTFNTTSPLAGTPAETITLSGILSSTGGLTSAGSGTLALSGNNTFTGGVNINGGTVQVGNAGALNSTAGSQNAVAFGASSTGTLAVAGNSVTVASLSATTGTPVVENANGSSVSNATLTVGNSTNASGTFTGTIQNGTGGGTLALVAASTGTLVLTGNDTYSGGTTINSGANLQLGSGSTTGTLLAGGAISDNGTFIVNRSNAVTQGTDFSSAGITGSGGLTQAGSGTLTLNVTNSYNGPTAVNAGALNVTGALSNSAVTVASGATLTGTGNNSTTGIIGGLTNVKGGGAITVSGANSSQILTVNGLSLGSTSGSYAAGNYATLNYTLSSSGAELIDVGVAGNSNGALTVNTGGGYITLAGIPTLNTTTVLMNYGSITGFSNLSLSSTTAGVDTLSVGLDTYTLINTGTALEVTYTGNPTPGVAYFTGAVSGTWNDISGAPSTNWSSNLAGTTDAGNIPGSTTDVILNATNATTGSTTLGANTTINSLNVISTGTTTVGAPGASTTLQINALADTNTATDASYTGNTAGTGISIASGAGPVTVNVPLILGTNTLNTPTNQTWTNASANPFTVTGSVTSYASSSAATQTLTLVNSSTGGTTISGNISNGSANNPLSITVNNTGSGVTLLSGTNSYSGATTITNGTLQAGSTQALGSGSAVSLANTAGATLNLNGFNNSIGSLAGGGGAGGNVTLGTATLTITGSSGTTYAGVLSGTGGGLTQSGTGTLALTAANTYSGATTISSGVVQLGNANAVQNSTVALNSANGLQFASGIGAFTLGGLSGTGNESLLDSANAAVALMTGNNNASTTYSGTLSGAGASLIETGTGTLALTGSNSYTGSTTINSGASLQLGNNGTTGALSASSAIGDNGTFIIDRSNAVTQGTDFSGAAINGSGGLTQAGSGTTTLTAANGFTGSITVSAGALAFDETTGSTQVSNISNNATVIGAEGTGTVNTLSGPISGTGAFSQTGAGTTILSGANSYSGGTAISAGTVQFAKTNAMSSTGIVAVGASGTLIVNAGGTGEFTGATTGNGSLGALLSGTGGQGGAVTYASGSILGIDTTNAGGNLTYTGSLTNALVPIVDKFGTGTLTIQGTVDVGSLYVTAGTVNLTGGSSATPDFLGNTSSDGAGTLLISSGTYNSANVSVDYGTGVTGGVNMTGGVWNYGGGFVVGRGFYGSFTLNGGTISSTGGQFTIGRSVTTSTPSFTVNSGTFTLTTPSTGQSLALMIGRNQGNGSMTVNGGVVTVSDIAGIATDNSGVGSLTISGGTTTLGSIVFNASSTNAAVGNVAHAIAGSTLSSGTLTVTGGTLYLGNNTDAANIQATLDGIAPGIVNLYGNTSTVTPLTSQVQTGVAINLSGGTVGANGNWASALNMTLSNANGGVTFQTANAANAAENISLSGILSGTGSLTETGSGVLSLSGSNTYTGGTSITGGTLQLANASALGSANSYLTSLNINGGTLDLDGNNFSDGANFTFSSGGIVDNSATAATMTIGNSNVSGTYGGNFGNGTGTLALTKAGTGTIILTGANTYTGATAVNAGILEYGASAAVAPSSSITVANGATIQLADSINVSSSGTITINGSGASGATGALEYLGTSDSNTGVLNEFIVLGSNATISSDTAATFDLSNTGTIANNGFNLTVSGGTGGGSTQIDGVLAGSGALIVNGGANLLLTHQSTYTGGTTISNGATLATGTINALPTTGTVTLGESTGNTIGILQLGASSGSSANQTLAYLATAGSGSGNEVIGSSSSHTSTLTIDNSTNDTYSGRIGGVTTAQKNVALTMSGSATLTLSGSNTYSGLTQITAGTLNITGSTLSSGTVIVANGGALAGTGSTGLVTVQAGGAINLQNGSVGTLKVGGLTTGDPTTASAMTFDIGSSLGSIDSINDTGILTLLGANGTTITIGNASGVTSLATGLYTLISYSGAETGGLANLDLLTTSLDGDTLSLVQGSGVIELDVSGAVPQAFFNGAGSDLATAGNYYTTAGGNTTLASAPGSTTDVFITSDNSSTTGSSVLSPTLNSALAINSLTFTGTGTPAAAGVNLTGTGTLTIEAATTTGNGGTNTAPNGITVQTGAGNDAIGVAVALGASQTWTVTDATNTLTVSGQVSDGGIGYALTKSGAGVLALSGSNIYSGGTTVSAGTLLASNTSAGGSATGTGALTVNGGATIGGYGKSSGTSFSVSGSGTTTSTRANVLAGLNSSSDTNVAQVLTLVASGASTIQNANLTFNLNAAQAGGLGGTSNGGSAGGLGGAGSGTELSVGSTAISFGTNQGSVQFALNLQNEPAIVSAYTPYVLIAGTVASGGSGVDGSQYSGLTLGARLVNGDGVTETIISGNNLQLAFGSSIDQQYYGTNSYLVLYQNTNTGTDDIDVVVVPEPGTWALMLGGLAVLIFWQRRRQS